MRSADRQAEIHTFGTGTAEFTPHGDYTGDGIDDITFWEPVSGLFTVMKSDNGFNDLQAANKNPDYYTEMQLGLYFTHLPLNWQKLNGRTLFSVVDHTSGYRFYRLDNNPNNSPTAIHSGDFRGTTRVEAPERSRSFESTSQDSRTVPMHADNLVHVPVVLSIQSQYNLNIISIYRFKKEVSLQDDAISALLDF